MLIVLPTMSITSMSWLTSQQGGESSTTHAARNPTSTLFTQLHSNRPEHCIAWRNKQLCLLLICISFYIWSPFSNVIHLISLKTTIAFGAKWSNTVTLFGGDRYLGSQTRICVYEKCFTPSVNIERKIRPSKLGTKNDTSPRNNNTHPQNYFWPFPSFGHGINSHWSEPCGIHQPILGWCIPHLADVYRIWLMYTTFGWCIPILADVQGEYSITQRDKNQDAFRPPLWCIHSKYQFFEKNIYFSQNFLIIFFSSFFCYVLGT